MSSNTDVIRDLAQQEYKWGFVTDIGEERIPKGLTEDTIRLISAKKNEPEFMLEWRLKAYRYWASQESKAAEPTWANVHYPPIDYQAITYYSAPKQKPQLESLDQLDPEILRTYEKPRHPDHRAEDARWRRRRRGLRQRLGRHHIQGEALRVWSDLLLLFRRGEESS
jgi:Fe-S cluster assembly protein SufB